MMETIILLLSFALLIIGMAGTVLPVLPGLILSFCGMLLYQFAGQGDLPNYILILFGILTIVSGIFNYIIPIKTSKKYGGSRWGSIGSFLGTILGMLFIPLPFGFLIGMLLGVALGEFLHDQKNPKQALRSTKGALIGFFLSSGFSFMIGLAMFSVVLYNEISKYF